MNVSKNLGAIIAVIMVVSMVAVGATAVGAVGAQSAVEDTTLSTSEEVGVTGALTDSFRSSGAQSTPELDSQSAQVADQLEDASGETTVLLKVDRNIQLEESLPSEFSSEELEQDSEATLQPVVDSVNSLSNAEVTQRIVIGNALVVEIDLDQHDIDQLATIPGVEAVAPNIKFEHPAQLGESTGAVSPSDVTVPDPDAEYTWGLQQIGVPSFDEQFDVRGEGANVTIIDDGISDGDHPDLEFAQKVNIVDNEINVGAIGVTDNAHGEHVAGTATGALDPAGDVPRYGVAPNASLTKINVFEGTPGASFANILTAVDYAVTERNADVAGMSLSAGGPVSTVAGIVDAQMREAKAAGTLVTVSAGNGGDFFQGGDEGAPVGTPSTEFDAFSVGASADQPVVINTTEAFPPSIPSSIAAFTGSNNDITQFSSGAIVSDRRSLDLLEGTVGVGDFYPDDYPRQYVQPDVAAPGLFVLSSGPLGNDAGAPGVNATSDGYSWTQGTSMAQPHVAGAVALIQSATEEDLGPQEISAALTETAEKPDNASEKFPSIGERDIRYGAGIINVTAAALAAQNMTEATGTVTDDAGEPVTGASLETEEGALVRTIDGEYSLASTESTPNVTVNAYGFDPVTEELTSDDQTFTLDRDLTVTEVVQGQPNITESGGEFTIVADVASVETFTLELSDSSSFQIGVDERDLTASIAGVGEIPFGEPVSLGNFTGLAEITVSISETADVATGDQLLLDHTFEGSGESVSVTTGPTTLVDAAGAVSSVSIDADFIGTINDQPTTTVTAEGILKDGEPSTGDRLTFTIGGEPVATGVSDGGVATAEVNAEALDLGPQEDVTVDVLEFEAAQTDTVDIVDEVADLEEGFNLLSVPQPATLTTQDVSSLNVWDSEDETYDTVTSPEFDTTSDLHDGLYVDASSDNARLGFTFNEDVPVGGTQDINTDWNLLGANFPLDSEDIGTSTTVENDLTGVDAAALELFRGDFSEFLTPNSQVGPFEAYWAFNPATSADDRGIASPSYDEGDRRDVLGQGESDFQPTITNIETTSVEDADDEVTLDDRDVVGASEQVVLVDVTVENNGNGTDVQFVTLEVAPQLGSGSGFELADQTGIELGPGESGDVTLAFVASQDDVSPLPPFFVPDDVAIEVTTEDGDAEDVGIPFDEGGITVEDQALSTDGEFVVENVDVAGHGTVQLVDANDNVLDSVEFAQGINEEVTFTVDDPANVTDDVTVRVLDDNELEELTSETVAVLDTRFTVSNNAPEFALVNETVDVPVTVTSNVAVPEDDVSVNFSVGGTDAGSQTVDLGAFGTETVSFPVDTTGLSVGDTVEHTATSPDDSDTRTLTIAEATLGFTDQSLNADGEVLVEDVTADEDQTIVVTDTDLNVVGEVDVADITTPGERGIDDEDVLVDVTGTSAGTHIAHVVADDFTVPGEGPGLVNQAANITVSTVDLADINNQTVSEAALPVEVVSSVTVDSEVVDAVGDRNSDYTVEIRQGGTVVGASDNLSDVSNGLTIELDDPVVVDEAQPEQTFTLTAVLVDQNGNEFDVSAGTNLDDDGFPVLTGNLDSAADEESFTVTVSGAENVNLPDQALGVANGSDAVLVNNIAADAGQFVVITPADDNNNILGVTQFDETVSGGERIVEFDQEVSAGEFRAHITTDTGLLGDDGALVTDTGVVSEAELDFQDQDFVGLTSEVTVATADLLDGIGNTTEFEIAIHQTTEDGGVGSIIGETDKDLTGANSDVTVSLDSTIDSNTTLVAMLHFSDGNDLGSPILQVAGDSVVPVLDSANLTKVESDQTFSDQALTTGEILIEDVRANQTSAVVVTYPNDGNLTIAGLTTGVSSTTGQEVSVTINDAGGFPGEHTVHIIPESALSQTTYSAGDNVSSETAANITSQESATVFDASVTIDDQAFEDSTSTFNVTTSDLQPATASDYVVVVHNQTGQPAEAGPADTDVGPALGATGVLNGSQENATVNLFEPLDETTDVLAMIHFPNAAGTGPGMPIPTLNGGNFGITDGSAGTITDTATVTIEQAEGGNLEFSNQALGSNGDVVVENVQPVDAVEVTTDQAFDPQNDFLVLTEGTEVTGENDIIDFVQLSNVANGTDVALNATGASPGTHTVVLHEPNEAGTGPDPDAPRTNASSGEVVNATATVFGGSVTVENQTLEQGTDALDNITVQTAELLDGSADGVTFTLNVTSGGTSLGTTTATGASTDVTVPLDEPVNRGTTDVTVTVEVNGAAVQQASGTSLVDLQDGATIDVVAAEYTVDTVSLNESTIAEGENINASVTVTNIGEIDGEKDITLRVLDDGNATGVSQTRENVQVFSSETRTLPFNGFDVSGLAGGDYTVEVEVPADENSNSVGLTIQVPAEFTVSFNDQVLGTNASGFDAVLVEDVSTSDDATVVVTYEDSGDLVIAGLTEIQSNNLGSEDVTVAIEDTGGFPGEHVAHLIPTSDLSTNYSAGDTVSNATASAIVDNDAATVFDGSVNITDQTFVGSTDEITVDSSDLQADGPAEYRIVVHDQTRANSSAVGPDPDDVGPALGFSDVLNGSESTTTIGLNQNITSTQDVLVMIHFPNVGGDSPGPAIPVLNGSAFGFGDGQAGTITDTATVEINEPANFTVTDLDPVDATVGVGDEFDVSANVTNTGTVEDTQEIELRLEPDGEAVANETVTLDSGETSPVTFENVSVDQTGEFNHTVVSEDDVATGNLTILESDSFFDVTITDAESPVNEGEEANVTVEIKNTGDVADEQEIVGTVAGPVSATFDRQTVQVDPGDNETIVLTWDTSDPGVSEAGDFSVEVSSNDTTDTAEVTVEGVDEAEFNLSNLDVPGTVDEGETFNVSVDVENIGNAAGTQNVILDIAGANVSEQQEFTLNASENATAAFEDISIGTADEYEIEVASNDDQVSQNITVEEVVQEAEFNLSNLDAPEIVDEGETFNVSVDVENTGNAEGTQNVTLDIESAGVSEQQEFTLNASENATAAFEDISIGTAGEYEIEVASNDDSVSQNITVEEVVQEAEFNLSNLDAPEIVDEGETFNVSVDVENTGNAEGTQNVTLDIESAGVSEQQEFTLNASENATAAFEDISIGTAGEYEIEVASNDDNVSQNITVEEVVQKAEFDVALVNQSFDVDYNDFGDESDPFDIEVNVTNVGDATGTQDIALDVTGPDGSVVLDNTTEVSGLAPGESETVTFADLRTSTPGEFNHEVSSEDDADTGTFNVIFEDSAFYLVTDLEAPAEAAQGQTITVNATVTNVGETESSQDIEFRLDPDGNFSNPDVDELVEPSLVLSPDESRELSIDVDVPAGSDTYEHGIFSEDDNATTQLEVPEEFFEVTVTGTNEPVNAGDELNVTAAVENTGDVDGTQTVTLNINDSIGQVDSEQVSLNSNETDTVTLTWATGSDDSGSYEATVSSENDNDAVSVSVIKPTFEVSNLQPPSATVTEGADPIDVSATVENTGDADGQQTVVLSVTDGQGNEELNQTKTVNLNSGANQTVTFSDVDVGSLAPGDYSHEIASDDDAASGNLIVESASSFFEVSNLQPPSATVTEGDDPIDVSATVENTGDADGQQTVVLSVTDGQGNEELNQTKTVDLNSGANQTVTFSDVDVGSLAPGDYSHEIASDDDAASGSLTIETSVASFNVTITGTNEPVTEGGDLNVTAQVENTGTEQGSQSIGLEISDGIGQQDSQLLTLSPSQTDTVVLTWPTSVGEAGNYNATVASANTTDTQSVTIDAESGDANFQVSIVDQTNETVAGATQSFDIQVENTGDGEGTRTVELDWGNGTHTNSTSVTLSVGETTTETLSVQTDSDEFLGEYDVSVSSQNDTATTGAQIIPERIISTDSAAPGDTVSVTVRGELDSPKNVSLIETFNRTAGDSADAFPPATYNGSGFSPTVTSFDSNGGLYSAFAGDFPESGSATLEFNYEITLPSGAAGEAFGFESDTSLFEIEGTEFSIGGDDAIAIVASSSTTQSAAVVAAP